MNINTIKNGKFFPESKRQYIGVFFLSIILVLSLTKTDFGRQGEDTMKGKSIEEALKEHTDELMSIPGVVGTAQGICNDKPCIKVFVIEKTKDVNQRIPNELDGYSVVVEETGEFKALP